MKKIMSICFMLVICGFSYAQEWQTNFDTAKQLATAEGKTIVLVFQGSDWCAPCIKMEQEIWSTDEFTAFAKDHYVMLQADFPKRRKNALSEEQQEHNNQLAATYNQSGYFPYVVVLDASGNVLNTAGYKKVSPAAYIETLEAYEHKVEAIQQEQQEMPFKRSLQLMGSDFEITVVANNSEQADQYIDIAVEEISRIERLISSWDENSQTSAINRNAGIAPVKVDPELFELIKRAIGISNVTDGAFDISYASMDRIWKFDGSMEEMPSEEKIKNSVSNVGFENIIMDEEEGAVFLKQEGMKIGFGAIGKGYAADKAKALLVEKGVPGGIINASGDMNTWGKQPNGDEWKVAITNPLNKDVAFALLPINSGAVVTSGNYEKFVNLNGKRYSHIIDPRSGYPSSGLISVTVFAPSAELADALATSVFVMGQDVGLNRINQLPQIECIIIDESGNVFTSTNIDLVQI